MAGPNPDELLAVVDRFPTPPESDRFDRADELLDGTYSAMADSWYPELQRRAAAYADGDVLRESVLEHVESVPSFRLSEGATPLPRSREALARAAATLDSVSEVSAWYADLWTMLADTRDGLSLFERVLHDFGYAAAHVLFLGASSPEQVVRRLRWAYRAVGVRIDETASEAGTERTAFTCPYRDLAAGSRGQRWVCHEKLDRVDDGYVTYLREGGIDYQRPRGCPDSERCYSSVARDGPRQWWPKTSPATVESGP
ncbi:hypothetical protein [Halobellus litoreus]|uniref:Uncharacterized protein n=1 Tax=Halobellus litoreus TaxID=755310 RepID=A0ABD6DYU0_9EURY|nr:hypothetical protein [Halobellus litoreus]